MFFEKGFLPIVFATIIFVGCAAQDTPVGYPAKPTKATSSNLNHRMLTLAKEPLKPEQTEELMETAAGNFFRGPGLGEAAIDVAGMVAFPPYMFVVAGNSLLSLAGFEPLSISRVLPEELSRSYGWCVLRSWTGCGCCL